MRNRQAPRFDYSTGDLPDFVKKLIRNFFSHVKVRQQKLYWEILGLTRRFDPTPTLVQRVAAWTPVERARFWKTANHWCNPLELRVLREKLKALKGDLISANIQIPFGHVRAVQECVRQQAIDVL